MLNRDPLLVPPAILPVTLRRGADRRRGIAALTAALTTGLAVAEPRAAREQLEEALRVALHARSVRLRDDGTQTVAELDSLNAQAWSSVWDYYDSTGNWNKQIINYDDGTQAVAQLDPLNTQEWSLMWDNYDAAGRLDTQSIDYDDGRRAWRGERAGPRELRRRSGRQSDGPRRL